METLLVFVVGLIARLLLFVLLFAVFAAILAGAIYAWRGAVAIRARATGTVDAEGAHWKPGLAYTTSHAWIERLLGRGLRIGLDDVARRILAGVSEVVLPPVGSTITRGQTLAVIRCGDRTAAIPSPVDGRVTSCNAALLADPSLFEREPYRAGWLIRVSPTVNPADGTLGGRAARAWLGEENTRLSHFLEHRLGLAAADGGTLNAPVSALLSEEAWQEATRRFLDAA